MLFGGSAIGSKRPRKDPRLRAKSKKHPERPGWLFGSHIERFDSALRLNVYLHTLALDGVYVKSDDDGLRFLRLPRPSEDEVYEVAFRTVKKVLGILKKKGGTEDGASNDDEPEMM